MPIDELDVARVALGARPLAEVLLQDVFDESGAGLLRSCDAIDSPQDVFRKCDGSLLFHATIIPPSYYRNYHDPDRSLRAGRILPELRADFIGLRGISHRCHNLLRGCGGGNVQCHDEPLARITVAKIVAAMAYATIWGCWAEWQASQESRVFTGVSPEEDDYRRVSD